MKRFIIIAIALISIQGIAQERRGEHRKGDRGQRTQILKDLTPEEATTLQTKKMTLRLDLSEAQQKEIYKLHLANAKERKAKMEAFKKDGKGRKELSKEQRYKMMNERLDKQIAMKKKMKSILTDEQYEKYEKGQKHKKMKGKKAAKQHKEKLRSKRF